MTSWLSAPEFVDAPMNSSEMQESMAPRVDNPLREWMNEPKNMHVREAILMHRLCFDLQLAAAQRGYYLNTYYDDVDHDGFDLIFDDQDTIKKTQVKTVESESATQQWAIHKRILRPSDSGAVQMIASCAICRS